jgi:hypothetical protein
MILVAALFACNHEKEAKGEEGLERDELGLFTTGTDGNVAIPFTVPDGAVATEVYCGPYGADHVATAETITAPDGTVVYDRAAPDGAPLRVDDQADLLVVTLPQAPELDLTPGDWSLVVHSYAADPVSLTCVAVHRTDPVGDSPTIDLDFVFIDADVVAPHVNAAEAPDSLESVLDSVATSWGAGGLSIGDVVYEDYDGDDDAFATVDGSEELGTLLRDVRSPGDRSLTIFVVQDITDDAGAHPAGVSGGTPGAAAVGGTSRSGIVVSAAGFADPGGPEAFARAIAHSGANFLGLYDTTSKDGSQVDPLTDTPECSDSDGDDVLNADECAGKGAENLMWWSPTADSVQLSDDQAWVLARSVAVR